MVRRSYGLPRDLYDDAMAGDAEAIAKLGMEADTLEDDGETVLHTESQKGNTERVRFLSRQFADKNLLVKLNRFGQTALHLAVERGNSEVVMVLIDAARHLASYSSANDDTQNPVGSFHAFIRQADGQMGNTALHLAVLGGNVNIVKLLVEADPTDTHIPNQEGKTPIYIAVEKGFTDLIKVILTTCTALSLDGPGGRTTVLHSLIQNLQQGKEEDRDLIMMTINAAKRWSSAEDPLHERFEELFYRIDESGYTVLQLAVYGNHVRAVELILLEDPVYQFGYGSENHGLLRLIYEAIDKECSEDIVKLLSQTFEGGINPDFKDVLALILAIKRRDTDSVLSLLEKHKNLVSFVDSEGWTPLHYVAYHELDSVLDIMIRAQEDIGFQFTYADMVPTPFHLAAKYEFTSTLMRLMQLWPVSSSAYTLVNDNGQNILHLAAFHNNKEMVNGILRYCPLKHKDMLLTQQDFDGDTPLHLLVAHGCFIPELIKYIALDTMPKNRKNWTPLDMLYFDDFIIGDQALIKIALDDVQTNQPWKFWSKTPKKNIVPSSVLPSRQKKKDFMFDEQKEMLMYKKNEQYQRMQKYVQRYREGTNSQVVVSALITTITFTVGFTMPGGLHQSGELNEGLAILSKKTAFKAFMISDVLALLLSTCSLFTYFLVSMSEDPRQVTKLHAMTIVLNTVSVLMVMLIFMTGTYIVLSQTPALAITICVIGSFFFLFVIVHLVKMVYDRRVEKNED